MKRNEATRDTLKHTNFVAQQFEPDNYKKKLTGVRPRASFLAIQFFSNYSSHCVDDKLERILAGQTL